MNGFRSQSQFGFENARLGADRHKHDAAGRKIIIALSAPLTPDHPSDPNLADLHVHSKPVPLIVESELLVRSNLPAASRSVLHKLAL